MNNNKKTKPQKLFLVTRNGLGDGMGATYDDLADAAIEMLDRYNGCDNIKELAKGNKMGASCYSFEVRVFNDYHDAVRWEAAFCDDGEPYDEDDNENYEQVLEGYKKMKKGDFKPNYTPNPNFNNYLVFSERVFFNNRSPSASRCSPRIQEKNIKIVQGRLFDEKWIRENLFDGRCYIYYVFNNEQDALTWALGGHRDELID